jgi:hypothetical protein
MEYTGGSGKPQTEEAEMTLYCGIDLHSTNHLVVVIDDNDKRLEERRLGNDLSLTLALLAPYQEELAGVAIESTFNWYWLVDGLQDAGYRVDLVNPADIKQYEGLKHTDDRYDAFWLAHLMRLGLLKTGYIYPREERAIRDVLRRRIPKGTSATGADGQSAIDLCAHGNRAFGTGDGQRQAQTGVSLIHQHDWCGPNSGHDHFAGNRRYRAV